MKKPLTIIMYHYVRQIQGSRYPGIKGLELSDFREQIGYLKKHHTFVSMKDCVESLHEGRELPPNGVLLTFDDGYIEHFTSVFPLLFDLKIPAAFFPPGRAVTERKLLDVNKIHFILACTENPESLVPEIFAGLDRRRDGFQLPSKEALYQELAKPNRYDTATVIFIKRLLQTRLPHRLRTEIVDELFKRHVSKDEEAFSYEIYMDSDQLRSMTSGGMELGSHGWDHLWLESLSPADQERDIDLSLEMLERLGSPAKRWAMCYPHGSYNDATLEILKRRDCAIGFTTQVGLAGMDRNSALTLPRLDTNDFPRSRDAEPNQWTQKVMKLS